MATGIRARLDGKHVLLTGVTGFVGEALLQRLLSDAPETRITVLVRPRGSTSGEERIEALLKKPIFEGCDGDRVSVLEGDMADVPALPARPRLGPALRGRRLLQPAGRPRLHHQRGRHPRPAGAGSRGR